ncbi:MAG: SDR family NAD(P)-dependent oxidoreductase, partial [Eubacterium sp.]
MTKILVTGAAGFIGFHLTKALLAQGHEVVGFDNMNDYYDITLKEDRLKAVDKNEHFKMITADLSNREVLNQLFKDEQFDNVVNLAAQAGVRYSIENPDAYIQSNIIGFFNILECCRKYPVKHLVYASSSSVYGANKKVPFST